MMIFAIIQLLQMMRLRLILLLCMSIKYFFNASSLNT